MKKKAICKLAITGGIGTGKSFVAEILRKKGIPVYFTDDNAKRLINSSPVIKDKLVSLVGNNVYDEKGILNKSCLAEYLFSSAENAERVNSIVHPVVKEDFITWADSQNREVVAMESAILFESGFDSLVDRVLTVTAMEETRIKRVMLRDNFTREQIKSRMAMQISEEDRCSRADYVLLNDGLCSVEDQIGILMQELDQPLGKETIFLYRRF